MCISPYKKLPKLYSILSYCVDEIIMLLVISEFAWHDKQFIYMAVKSHAPPVHMLFLSCLYLPLQTYSGTVDSDIGVWRIFVPQASGATSFLFEQRILLCQLCVISVRTARTSFRVRAFFTQYQRKLPEVGGGGAIWDERKCGGARGKPQTQSLDRVVPFTPARRKRSPVGWLIGTEGAKMTDRALLKDAYKRRHMDLGSRTQAGYTKHNYPGSCISKLSENSGYCMKLALTALFVV